jgi:hypothetical protein
METFRTQFEIKDVPTQATVEEIKKNTFGCTIHLVDFFDGGELPVESHNYDTVIERIAQGEWKVIGEPKMKLDDSDIQNLGKAIEGEKMIDL